MLELGKCSNCGVSIMDLTKRGKDKLSDNYRDHIIELSNNTIMRVGVCTDCKVLLVQGDKVQETANNILQNHIDYWDSLREIKNDQPEIVGKLDDTLGKNELASDYNYPTPIDFDIFTVVDPNISQDKFLEKRNNKLIIEE